MGVFNSGCLGYILTLLFILLLSMVLLWWLKDMLWRLFSRELPNTLARLCMIGILGNGLYITFIMTLCMCPCLPSACQITVEAKNIKRQPNKTATYQDDICSFWLLVKAKDVKSKTWTAFLDNQGVYSGTFGIPKEITGVRYKDKIIMTVVADKDKCCSGWYEFPIPSIDTSENCVFDISVFDLKSQSNDPSDPSDDTWSFSFFANGSQLGKKGWTGNAGGMTVSSYYGQSTLVKGIKEFSQIKLKIIDKEKGGDKTILIDPPKKPPGSIPCKFNIQVFDRVAHSNAPSDDSDDTWSFQVIVDGNNLGKKGWIATVGGQTVSSMYVMPKLVGGFTRFSQVTMNIIDRERGCDMTILIAAPSKPAPYPSSGNTVNGNDYCKTLNNAQFPQNNRILPQLPHNIPLKS